MFRLDYNAPVTITFAILCGAVFAINHFMGGTVAPYVTLHPHFDFNKMTDYLSLFTYVFGHANIDHLLTNFTMFLLIGPVIEERFGAKKLLMMMAITVLLTAILDLLLLKSAMMGADGLVFMLIVLVSFTNVKEGHIPVTFLLVVALFLGKEIYDVVKLTFIPVENDTQFMHLVGGLCGAVFGLTKWFK